MDEHQVKQWKTDHHPIRRFCAYLEGKGWWDGSKDRELRDKERLSVRNVRSLGCLGLGLQA